MSVPKLLSAWRAEPSIAGNIAEWRSLPARTAHTSPMPPDLHPALVDALSRSGIFSLYSHQIAAWEHLQAGKNVVVVTGTASGKTLCFNLPVLDRLLRQPDTRALYLYPTKALAQDQSAALRTLTNNLEISGALFSAAIYDGDTPTHVRPAIRATAQLLFSNPDMLHIGILPHHTSWVQFFSKLRFVIIDEVHTYRGVFGSHVANVIRRLKRIAGFYGAAPQFILTSATIANPAEFAGKLIEEPIQLIDQDGSARGPRHFLIYNPPITDRNLGLRRSALQESVRLAEDLLAYLVQTILFARTRRSVELLLTYLRNRMPSTTPAGPAGMDLPVPSRREPPVDLEQAEIVRGYRSGYLPEQRRAIERGLRQGQVRAVVATTALELGIDIGGMGAALLVGYPGTIADTLQQAGRAGRGEAAALAVLVAVADPLDQFLVAHPEYLFERSPEHALINPDNLLILLDHLRCAAFELPFQSGSSFGSLSAERLAEFLDFLAGQGELHRSGEKYFWIAGQYPAQGISLRSTSANPVILRARTGPDLDAPSQLIGQVDRPSAMWMVHPQAVYMHEGQTYLVEALDLEENIAWLRATGGEYYTEPQRETTVQLIAQLAVEPSPKVTRAFGEIQVTTQVTGYRKIRWYTHENLGQGDLALPPTDLITTGYWLALEEATVESLRQQGLWSNDPNDYGPNWRSQRDLARARDGYRCQICGAPEQERSHYVHHITPFRAFTSYLQANKLENLATLCPSCHRVAETAVRVRSGLSGLAYVLSHLAPFFLMCDLKDLGVHADPQSPLAEGKPTVVLYEQIPAGIGFSQHLFSLHHELLQRAQQLVAACECNAGCPACVGPASENGLGCKKETLAILESLIAG
jgi:DEAD/DEAH box helicase domain-containing protein